MEMYSPVRGKLRRTHHDGVFVKFAVTERDYSVYAKIGYVQVREREREREERERESEREGGERKRECVCVGQLYSCPLT